MKKCIKTTGMRSVEKLMYKVECKKAKGNKLLTSKYKEDLTQGVSVAERPPWQLCGMCMSLLVSTKRNSFVFLQLRVGTDSHVARTVCQPHGCTIYFPCMSADERLKLTAHTLISKYGSASVTQWLSLHCPCALVRRGTLRQDSECCNCSGRCYTMTSVRWNWLQVGPVAHRNLCSDRKHSVECLLLVPSSGHSDVCRKKFDYWETALYWNSFARFCSLLIGSHSWYWLKHPAVAVSMVALLLSSRDIFQHKHWNVNVTL